MTSAYMVGSSANLSDALAQASTGTQATSTIQTIVEAPKKPKTVEEMVNEAFKNDPIMTKVAWCESRNRQFEKDGTTVFRGKVNNDDVGVMQINTYYHLETSKKLGMDIMTTEGNIAYGKYLFKREGTTPWNSSKPCWGKYLNQEVAVK